MDGSHTGLVIGQGRFELAKRQFSIPRDLCAMLFPRSRPETAMSTKELSVFTLCIFIR